VSGKEEVSGRLVVLPLGWRAVRIVVETENRDLVRVASAGPREPRTVLGATSAERVS